MNFQELNEQLSGVFKDIRSGKIKPDVGHELTNTAGAIQANVRLALLNARLRGEVPNLKYFGEAKKPAVKGARRG